VSKLDKRHVSFISLMMAALIFMLLCFAQGAAHLREQPLGFMNIQMNDKLFLPDREGWTLTRSDGTSEALTLPAVITDTSEEGFTISLPISLDPDEKMGVYFDNQRYSVVVTQDDDTLYMVNTTELAKQLRYSGYRIVNIESNGVLTLRFYGSENGEYNLRDIYIAPLRAIVWNILYSETTTIILLLLFLMMTIICNGAMIVRAIRGIPNNRVFVITILLVTLIIWAFNDSTLTAITNIPQEISGALAYMTLMIMPVELIYFFWISFDRELKLLRIFTYVAILLILLENVLSITGVAMLNKTFFLCHIEVFVVTISCMTLAIKQRMRKANTLQNNLLLASCAEMSLTGFVSIGSYWYIGGEAYRIVFLTGVLIFIIILIAYLVTQELNDTHELKLRESRMEMQEKLAYVDELTNLGNRRAFEKRVAALEEAFHENRDAVLVMLDVNGLKTVNDNYGHASGDELLISAAEIIKRVYKGADCFRVGGDEFTVIITENPEKVGEYAQALRDEIERNNHSNRLKLSLAVGTSHLLRSNGTHISISDWKQEADVLMYRNKLTLNSDRVTNREQDLRDIIYCIVSTVEARDIYTASHSQRVGRLALKIGEMLGLSNNTLDMLASAAHLHDIGKIGIPDHILTKQGHLSDEEYKVIQTHSAIGAGIIGSAKGMQDISNIILCHHERFDGKGYPAGLIGNEIPVESRIIAIADSIDAMTSKRCYRDSLNFDECKMEIVNNAGRMYDPAIVELTLENWAEIEKILKDNSING